MLRPLAWSVLLLCPIGCRASTPEDDGDGPGLPGATDGAGATGTSESGDGGDGNHEDDNGEDGGRDDEGDDDAVFDLGGGADDGDSGGGEESCSAAERTPCDDGTDNPFAAAGIDCPGGPDVSTLAFGASWAIGTRTAFGADETYAPREGESFAVIGTGWVEELDTPNEGGSAIGPCSRDLGPMYDPYDSFPFPLLADAAVGDCAAEPGAIGTGDCSGSLADPVAAGAIADYTEIRFTVEVPDDVHSLSYDVAFVSTEYPIYADEYWTDTFVAWVESESWTGNTGFDSAGAPVSLASEFFTVDDGDGKFAGTCMEGHGGTPWLSVTTRVEPGEEVIVVFAVFGLREQIRDSYAFIDNVRFGCDEVGPTPTTTVAQPSG